MSIALRIEYDSALPIVAHREQILAALQRHRVVVVCGATGSGKTTQLPKICLEAGRGLSGLIGHTQPRRIAARAIAARLATELGTQVGAGVGYQVRFTDHTGPDCRIKLMTDGILLRELERDPLLRRYDTLIVDEAHERSLNIDFLLGVLKGLLPQRPDLRILITSATIDPQRFAEYFGGAPVIEVSGRSYPVEVRYRPLAAQEDEGELSLGEGIVEAVRELDRDERGDVLVFLPGERQIREAAETLGKARLQHTEVLALYARLSSREQQRIFEPHGPRRIVLATNVAETSLTVPGIRHVIDSGLARISRYSVRGKVQRLPIEPISQASAEQRKGRAGRERAGICIRLYAQEDFELRPAYTAPEVLRTNLASVILRMAALELGDPQDFPFLDPPQTRLINDGYRLLQELKAVDEARRVTSVGRQIAMLPLDPRLARMLLSASHHRCLAEMLVIAAFLAAQDPRERPAEAQAQADQKHAELADPRSDFVTILNLWQAFREQSAALSGNQLRKWCRERFLSYLRMREWQELHRQLTQIARELKLRASDLPASYADLHQAILTGFLGNIGALDERREYQGARGTRFLIAPGTPLASKPPKWLVAASLVDTTRLYARMVAAVEPQWIEAAGAHLVKRSYAEPHWVEERGYVAAYESSSLYGLTLSARRRVNYASVFPQQAREIFVREALVEGRTRLKAAFLERNRRLREQIEALEAKVRRRDMLADEQTLCEFYLQRLPEWVHSIAALEKWLTEGERRGRRGRGARGRAGRAQDGRSAMREDTSARNRPAQGGADPYERLPHDETAPSSPPGSEGRREQRQGREHRLAQLTMQRADAMSPIGLQRADQIASEDYPDSLRFAGNELPLTYRFEPGASDDGVTVTLPLPLLPAAAASLFSAPIPGWRLEAITAVLRSLPKQARKLFVPVPEHAERAAAAIAEREDFHAALADWIARSGGPSMSAQELAALPVPMHLRMNIRVVDLDGAVLGQGRDLISLKQRIRAPDIAPQAAAASAPAPQVHRRWDFGELPPARTLERMGLRYTVYPTLRDVGGGVELAEAAHPAAAQAALRRAVLRLALLALPEQLKYARKRYADERELVLLGQGVNRLRALADALAEQVFVECFLREPTALPRSAGELEALLQAGRGGFGEAVDRVQAHALAVLRELRKVRQRLAALTGEAFDDLRRDVQQQLHTLMPPDFPVDVPPQLWPHLPRYLAALARRLEKARGNLARDAQLASRVTPALRAFQQLAAAQSVEAGGHLLGGQDSELARLQWMIEELRVSLYAQDLRTALPVSEKRLAEQLERAHAEARQAAA